jgi:hypothetical protein
MIKRIIFTAAIILAPILHAKEDSSKIISLYIANVSLSEKHSSDLNKPEVFDVLLGYVKKSSPWWTHEKIVSGLKEKKLVGKSKLAKAVVDNPKNFLIYYTRGGLSAEASLYPLEKNLSDNKIRQFFINTIKKRVKKEVDGICSEQFEEYCEGFMDCNYLHKYFQELSNKLKKFPKEKEDLKKYYALEATKAFDNYSKKIISTKETLEKWSGQKITDEKVNKYFSECKNRIK